MVQPHAQWNHATLMQSHGQTFQENAACSAQQISQLVGIHHILTDHECILSAEQPARGSTARLYVPAGGSSVLSQKSVMRKTDHTHQTWESYLSCSHSLQ